MLFPRNDADHPLARSFKQFLQDPEFPCVGAKVGAVPRPDQNRRGAGHHVGLGRSAHLSGPPGVCELVQARARPVPELCLSSRRPRSCPRRTFERHLWARCNRSPTRRHGWDCRYDERVRAHPDDPHFSLSFGGEAFFIVGLHPNASRKARRFEAPALVFNLHDQFEQLRADGRYHKLRDRIVERDLRFSGRSIRCWRPMGRRPRRASTAAAPSTTLGSAPFIRRSAASRAA